MSQLLEQLEGRERRAECAKHERHCSVCGTTGYGPSYGGPDLCPACDCGGPRASVTPQYAQYAASHQRLKEALELIHNTDPVDAALDPHRAVRIAREALRSAP